MTRPNVNVTVGGPKKPTNYTYKTVVLKNNLPFASQVTEPNCIYVIKWDFDLGGETVTIPENCILKFEGGSLSNGTLVGNNTGIEAGSVEIFRNIGGVSGSWNTTNIYPEWFGALADGTTDCLGAIQKCIDVFPNSTVCLTCGNYGVSGTIHTRLYNYKTTHFYISANSGLTAIQDIDGPILHIGSTKEDGYLFRPKTKYNRVNVYGGGYIDGNAKATIGFRCTYYEGISVRNLKIVNAKTYLIYNGGVSTQGEENKNREEGYFFNLLLTIDDTIQTLRNCTAIGHSGFDTRYTNIFIYGCKFGIRNLATTMLFVNGLHACVPGSTYEGSVLVDENSIRSIYYNVYNDNYQTAFKFTQQINVIGGINQYWMTDEQLGGYNAKACLFKSTNSSPVINVTGFDIGSQRYKDWENIDYLRIDNNYLMPLYQTPTCSIVIRDFTILNIKYSPLFAKVFYGMQLRLADNYADRGRYAKLGTVVLYQSRTCFHLKGRISSDKPFNLDYDISGYVNFASGVFINYADAILTTYEDTITDFGTIIISKVYQITVESRNAYCFDVYYVADTVNSGSVMHNKAYYTEETSFFQPAYNKVLEELPTIEQGIGDEHSIEVLSRNLIYDTIPSYRYKPGMTSIIYNGRPLFKTLGKWVYADGAEGTASYIGTFNSKPYPAKIYEGFKYFCTDLQSPESNTPGVEITCTSIIVDTTDPENPVYRATWADSLGREVKYDYPSGYKGTFNNKPALTSDDAGYQYFDTTNNRIIIWNGTAWCDATGTPLE